jgi:cobalt/nickel transport system ATP-binding protein
MEPDVLLLDEPTASLDKAALDRVAHTLNGLRQSMIVVSHEPDFLAHVTGRLLTIRNGRIEERVRSQEVPP